MSPVSWQLDLLVFACGWLLGWCLLWRLRPLPPFDGTRRDAIAVVVPARNEADALPHLIPPLAAQLRTGDELVVVDDHSDDATATIAASGGAVLATQESSRVIGSSGFCRNTSYLRSRTWVCV